MEITVITGEQDLVYKVIEQYFNYIQLHIDAAEEKLLEQNPNLYAHPHFERRVMGVRPINHDDIQRTNDRLHLLLYKDKVVATVTEQYDNFNYAQYSFFERLDEVLERVMEEKERNKKKRII